MDTVYLVTSNPGKADSLRNILADLGLDISINRLAADYPEDKSEGTTEHVAREGARWCADKFTKNVLVTDVGLYVTALNGFPGVNTAFSLKRIGNKGIIKLLAGEADRSVEWVLSLGYGEPGGGEVRVFTSRLMGTVPERPHGDDGFGFDPIFRPEGESKTLAEDVVMRDRVSPFRSVLIDFANWYVRIKRP